MGGASYDLDFVTSSLTWGEGLYTEFGYDKSAPTNSVDWWTDHIHPNDAMILNYAMDKLLDPYAQNWLVEYRFRKADNSYVVVEDQATIHRDSVGKAIRLTGTLTPLATYS
ncbi:MAG TPA: PAS domain-containing protein [Candidatus Saccharimonadales bacterium]|nr:PAS domain-containing protein [Candidatus Saccharimonadales bacterium]